LEKAVEHPSLMGNYFALTQVSNPFASANCA
jgi:hypothetical protein